MGELRAPGRALSSTPGTRRRGVQGRLAIAFGDESDAGAPPRSHPGGRGEGFRRPARASAPIQQVEGPRPAPPVFHPLAYRGVVAGWTIENRERWGRRANELEDAGLAWRDAEAQAFVDVWLRIRQADAPREPALEPADRS